MVMVVVLVGSSGSIMLVGSSGRTTKWVPEVPERRDAGDRLALQSELNCNADAK